VKAEKPEPSGRKRKVNVTLRLPPVMIDKCDELIERMSAGEGALLDADLSRGEFLRRALEIGLRTMEQELDATAKPRTARVKAAR
jgi:hypothetical protein